MALVRQGLRTREWPFEAEVRIAASATDVATAMPSAVAIVEEDATHTIVDVGSLSLDRMVRDLAGLALPCEVLAPTTLRVALRRHAEAVVAANR